MMKTDIRPTGHHVLIKPDDIEEVSEGGIVLQTAFDSSLQARERAATTTGIIVAVGETAWKDFGDGRPWAQVGDHVYFTRHVSKSIKDGDDEYFLMTDENVLCVIRSGKDG